MSEQVLRGLMAAVQAMPSDPYLRLQLAAALRDAGRADEAMAHATVVLSIEPGNTAAQGLMAELQGSQGARGAGLDDRPAQPRNQDDAAGPSSGFSAPYGSAGDVPAAPIPAEGGDAMAAEDLDSFLEGIFQEAVSAGQAPLTLADVGGLTKVKQRLHLSFFQPLENPELSKAYGKSAGGGLLLYGPPGCGKTFLAKAVAGQLGASFLSVGLHDVLDMWMGASERNVHQIFQEARQRTPCVLFLDEIDALGSKRSQMSHSGGRNVVVQLLTELDGIDSQNDQLFVLGATNTPWDVDPALLRPGRLDRTLFVSPPDDEARRFILERSFAGRPVEGLNYERVASRTNKYSGADLRLLSDAATEIAFTEASASGQMRPIRQADLERAVGDVKPTTKSWFDMARNFVTFGNLGGEYDDLVEYMKENKLL